MNPAPPVTSAFPTARSLDHAPGSHAGRRRDRAREPTAARSGKIAGMKVPGSERGERSFALDFVARTSRVDRAAAAFAGILLTILWTWWALAEGAFFIAVLYPGAIVLYLGIATLLGFAPLRIRGGGPHEIALLALLALVLWTIVSIAWTPARDMAVEDAERCLVYAATFFTALWFGTLLLRRIALAVAPFVIAIATVCVVTIVVGLVADPTTLLDEEFTLDFPLGYRNATALFLVFGILAGISLAARRRGPDWMPYVGAALGATSGSLMLLCQSRGSVPALVVGIVVLLAAAPERGRALLALAAVLAPAALTAPWALEPFTFVDDPGAVGGPLRDALFAAAAAGGLAFGLIALVQRAERRITDPEQFERNAGRLLIVTGAVLVLAVPIGLVATDTNPIDSLSNTVEKGNESTSAVTENSGSRFLFTGGLQRSDYWSVALDEFGDAPLLGDGAGGFRTRYLQDRDSDQNPRDAHSVELELLGELGIPGLLLFGLAFGAGIAGALKTRRLGPEGAFVAALGLTIAGAWLAQASIDWFWSYPVLTAPMFGMLGIACAPQALALEETTGKGRRRIGIVACLAVSLLLVPLFLAERLTVDASTSYEADPQAAIDATDRAASLNPFEDQPLLVQAAIAERIGDDELALEAIERARTRQPDEWAGYLLGARVLGRTDPEAALSELALGQQLNPRDPKLAELEKKLKERLAEGAQQP